MDGSLLSDSKQLPPDFFDVYRQLRDRGITFAVASGRQYYTLQEEFFQVRDSIYIIAENGAYMAHRDELLHLDPMDRAEAHELIVEGRKVQDAFSIVCGRNGAYAEDNDVQFINEARKYFHRFELVDDLLQVDDEILKYTLCDFRNAEFNSLPHFQQFKDRFKVTVGGKLYLDVMGKNVNKGVALRKLQAHLGLTAHQTMVFGDYLNDTEMLQAATHSYAMKNAHPEILSIAKHVTAYSNNEQGVMRAIKELCLLEAKVG